MSTATFEGNLLTNSSGWKRTNSLSKELKERKQQTFIINIYPAKYPRQRKIIKSFALFRTTNLESWCFHRHSWTIDFNLLSLATGRSEDRIPAQNKKFDQTFAIRKSHLD